MSAVRQFVDRLLEADEGDYAPFVPGAAKTFGVSGEDVRAVVQKMKQPRKRSPAKSGRPFIVILKSVGNPDFREHYGEGVLSPTVEYAARDLRDARDMAMEYISKYDLGGGNWAGGQVYKETGPGERVEVANISYNGRVWEPGRWTAKTAEIKV